MANRKEDFFSQPAICPQAKIIATEAAAVAGFYVPACARAVHLIARAAHHYCPVFSFACWTPVVIHVTSERTEAYFSSQLYNVDFMTI